MTNEARTKKDYFQLNGGLNTESNEINFPDGYTTDEANYELLSDGSRRRRKGLAVESGAGSALSVGTLAATAFCQSYVWKNVGGDPTKSFIVHQIGDELYFTDDATTLSTTWHSDKIDLTEFGAEATVTTANIRDKACRFADGRGDLFVSGPYLNPIRVKYNASTDDFTVENITVLHRDFAGVDDGVDWITEPESAGLPTDHRYNLLNRGWKETDISTYKTSAGSFPSKAAVWFKGYKRTYGASVSEADGTRSFDATKMAAEPFSNSSAPQGSLFLNPQDTRFAFLNNAGTPPIPITSWSYVDAGSTWTITVTVASGALAAAGITNGASVTMSGMKAFFYNSIGTLVLLTTLNGTKTVSNVTATTFDYSITEPNFSSWQDQYNALGQIGGDLAVTKSDGQLAEVGFNAIAWYAGRVWYGGLANSDYADHLFFSQVATKANQYGNCYQAADPTGEYFNALTPVDGGVLVVPGLTGVVDLIPLKNSLVILSSEGVWEVSGGQSVFQADRYSVRKISNAPCNSATGAILVEDAIFFTGPSGIHMIAPNQYTGLLEAQNIIQNTILTYWNGSNGPTIEEQKRLITTYDDAKRRIYFLYGADETENLHDTALIFDVKQGAWFRYTFNTATDSGLLSVVAISEADDASSNQKMKFLYQASATTIQVADFEQTTFDDFDGSNGPLPYMVTGWDNIGDFQRRRQAPVVTVFAKRTETGYTDTGNGWSGDNESSTLMTAYWDWTDDSVTGKIGSQNETYRHTRNFVPSGASDVDGYPVVVTRNKVRGRGRVLQLRFDGATDKDSHLLGYTVNYKVSSGV